MAQMFSEFGWKAVVGIAAANAVYFFTFRRELVTLSSSGAQGRGEDGNFNSSALAPIR